MLVSLNEFQLLEGFQISVYMSVCVCCVCVYEKERERERVAACACVMFVWDDWARLERWIDLSVQFYHLCQDNYRRVY